MRFTTIFAITALVSGAISASIERRDSATISADITDLGKFADSIAKVAKEFPDTGATVNSAIPLYNVASDFDAKLDTAVTDAQALSNITDEQSKQISASVEELEEKIKGAIGALKSKAHQIMLVLPAFVVGFLFDRLDGVRANAVSFGTALAAKNVAVGDYPTAVDAVFTDAINTMKAECVPLGFTCGA